MHNNNSAPRTAQGRRLHLDVIAAKMILARKQQTLAYRRRPVDYVTSLLHKLGESGDVPVQDLSDELRAFLPDLSKRESDRLVSLYLRGRDELY